MIGRKTLVRKFRAAVLFFCAGAVIGTLCDSLHVLNGVEIYPEFEGYPFMFRSGQPFWVPILMGSATVVIAWMHLWTDRWLREGYARVLPGYRSLRWWLPGLGFAIAAWLGSGFLPLQGLVTDLVLASAGLFLWASLDRTPPGLLQAGLTAIGGVLVEGFLSDVGAFGYAPLAQGPWGVPSWLPWIYFGFSPVIGGLARRLVRKKE